MSVNHAVVVDSKGKTVGATIGGVGLVTSRFTRGTQIHPTVLLRVGQHLVAVNVDRDRFFGGTLFFESPDCSDTPWFPDPPLELGGRRSLLPQTAIELPGQTLYVEKPGAVSPTVTLRSRRGEGFSSCVGENSYSPITVPAVQAQPLVDLLTVFTPPFSLRAAP